MNFRTVTIICLLMVAPLLARDSTDVIVMKNGDHLTGEIKGLNRGRAVHQHAVHPRHQPCAMVEGGPHREQAVVPGEDGGWRRCTQERFPQRNVEKGRPMTIEVVESSTQAGERSSAQR